MKATNNGSLAPLNDCWVDIPNAGKIIFKSLPDISDAKTAVYNNEAIIGRSTPLYTYSHSGDRTISMTMHFFVVDKGDVEQNLMYLKWIQSAVYPRKTEDTQSNAGQGGGNASPFLPPVICQIKCGFVLADEPLCCACQSYSVKFPTEVVWDEKTFCPFRFDVETSWIVVYTSNDLPDQKRIYQSGR